MPRVIREGLELKAAISCHLGKLGASFILAYHVIHEILLVDSFKDPWIEASLLCRVRKWDVI